jgi:hypothetical protein
MKNFTFGSELEIADIDTKLKLPEGNKWDYRDYTIVNSSGVGNDPKKEIVRWGGEINVKPTDSAEEQAEEIFKVYSSLGDKKSVNYTTNFHIHVRVPGLNNNIELLKKVATYIFKHQESIFSITEKLEEPTRKDYDSDEAFKGAKKRFARRKVSHQNKLSEKIYNKMLLASTPKEFYEAHAPRSKDGKLQFQLVTRCGINLMQLFNETDTIEFRHFSMSFNEEEVYSCIKWCEFITDAMIYSNKTPSQIFEENNWMIFPKFHKYNHELQKIFNLTHFGKLSRETIMVNLLELVGTGVIKVEDIE